MVAAAQPVTVPSFSLMAPMVPPPLCPLPSQSNLDMPSLFGQDLFWQDITPGNQAAAITTMSNDFFISAAWKVQISENNKLRIVDENGHVLKAGVRAVPPLPNTEYFVGVRTPVNMTPNKEFPDFKALNQYQSKLRNIPKISLF